jgi:hypothetical protein
MVGSACRCSCSVESADGLAAAQFGSGDGVRPLLPQRPVDRPPHPALRPLQLPFPRP